MSSDSMLVFQEANATQMAEVFRKRVAVVKNFIPDVSDGIKSSVGDWTGESRQACDAALKRLEAHPNAGWVLKPPVSSRQRAM